MRLKTLIELSIMLDELNIKTTGRYLYVTKDDFNELMREIHSKEVKRVPKDAMCYGIELREIE